MISKSSRLGVGSLIGARPCEGLRTVSGDLRLLFLLLCKTLQVKHDVLQHDSNDTIQTHFLSFQRGEESGFAYFFKLHYRSLVYFANNLIEDTPAAEDIVDDSFVKLWERRASIQTSAGFKPYLYTVVKNACLDYLAQQKRERLTALQMAFATENAVNPLIEEAIKADVWEGLFAALKKLPRQKGKIIHLFYTDDKSIREIAEELGISPNTVRNQKAKAVEGLYKAITGTNASGS